MFGKIVMVSHSVDVDMDSRRWPIAPDGYIPNSVIRGWRMRGKDLHPAEKWDNVIAHHFQHVHDLTEEDEALDTEVFWLDFDLNLDIDMEEDETIDVVKIRETEEKSDAAEVEQPKEEEKEEESRKEEEEVKVHVETRREPVSEIQIENNLQELVKTSDEMEQESISSGEGDALTVHVEFHEDRPPVKDLQPPKEPPAVPAGDTSDALTAPETRVKERRPQKPLRQTPGDLKLQLAMCFPKAPAVRLHSSSEYANISTLHERVKEIAPADLQYPALMSSGGLGDQSFSGPPPFDSSASKALFVQGFQFSQAGMLSTAQSPRLPFGKESDWGTFFPVQHVHPVGYHRVVHQIQLKDGMEPMDSYFCHIIPLAARHSFISSKPSGMTRYGILQFHWTRGSEEIHKLEGTSVKLKHRYR